MLPALCGALVFHPSPLPAPAPPCRRPSAIPIEVFWHVVYSWICKHLYLYARSRRTSGPPWRPVSGLRPPLPYAAARSSSPVPRASRRPRLPATCAAPTRPCATPFMPSTSAVSRRCSRTRRDRTRRRPSSTLGACEALRALLHQSPRTFGKPTSRWTLALAAEVSFAQGLTPRLVSDETIRVALRRLRRVLEAGQTLDHQSRSGLCPKKKRRDRLIQRAMTQPTWALGFGDEVWWSRLAQPNQHWLDRRRGHAQVAGADARPRTIPIPRRWPVMACWCGRGRSRPTRCGCGLSQGAP